MSKRSGKRVVSTLHATSRTVPPTRQESLEAIHGRAQYALAATRLLVKAAGEEYDVEAAREEQRKQVEMLADVLQETLTNLEQDTVTALEAVRLRQAA